MAPTPKIPPEQRSFADQGAADLDAPAVADRRDRHTDAQSGQPGDADVNLDQQGRFGNLKQNSTTRARVHER